MGMNVGLIGAGNIAVTQYLPALKKCYQGPVLIYDTQPERLINLHKQFDILACDLEKITKEADIIFITTPPDTHYDLLKKLIPYGKKLVCEKPFVLTHKHAVELTELAKQYQTPLLVAHIRRIFPAIELAKQFVQTHQLHIEKAAVFEGSRFSYKATSGYTTQSKAGGVLPDTGSHALDCLFYICGWDKQPIEVVIKEVFKNSEEPSHEFEALFAVNDCPVNMILSRFEALSNKINLYTNKGLLEVPLTLKPFIKFTTPSSSQRVEANPYHTRYFSEAFSKELDKILRNADEGIFDSSCFINLTYLIEELGHAARIR